MSFHLHESLLSPYLGFLNLAYRSNDEPRNRPMTTEIRLAALGSSFAAGPSILPIENGAAGRSSRNYAHQLSSKLAENHDCKVTLTDLTVSGATILNVLEEPQQCGNVTFAPQIQGIPADADIVTFTCGGNDLKYIGSLIHDSVVSELGSKYPMLNGSEPASAPAITQKELLRRLRRSLDEIHRIAPNAKVYLVQYLPIIGQWTKPLYDVPLSREKIHHYDNVANLLAQAYIDAAESRDWAEVVDLAEGCRQHYALGSEEAFVRGFSIEMLNNGLAPYHPKLAGHTAIAEILYRQVMGRRGNKDGRRFETELDMRWSVRKSGS